jgi:TATA-box binding protein (TBP) (component of TFIID and TFIIIB)
VFAFFTQEAPVVLLCFYSGKVVLTGGKTIRDIEWGWNMLWKIVKKYVQ